MPISLSPVQSPQNLQANLIHADGGNGSGKPAEARAKGDIDTNPVDKDDARRDKITLSHRTEVPPGPYVPAAPYAEIWKNGRKVAEIDSRGEVSVFEGVVAAHPGVGTGLMLAAQQAAMVARSIGGEIRVGGMVTDVPTLAMKARLSNTYRN